MEENDKQRGSENQGETEKRKGLITRAADKIGLSGLLNRIRGNPQRDNLERREHVTRQHKLKGVRAELNQPGEEEGFQPDKEFYLKNDRSREIREVSLAITRDISKLLHDPDIAKSQEKQKELYARLEAHNGELIELGIEPNMHEGRDISVFRANPVTAAEFLAGQLYDLTGRSIPTENATRRIAQEFGTVEPNMPVIAESGTMPRSVYDFQAVRETVNLVNGLFDAEPPSQKTSQ